MRIRVALAFISLVSMLVLVAPAHAAFPGKNGKIAFASTRDGNPEIYTMYPDGTEQTNVTNNAAEDASPAWSPDGKKIAFVSQRDGPPAFGCTFSPCGVIYVMNADGTNPTRLTSPSDAAESPAWSPDGSKIAVFVVHSGQGGISVMNSDGSNLVSLNNPNQTYHKIAWSPDGQEIAYDWVDESCDAACSKAYHISKVRPDGTGRTELFGGGGFRIEPDWSPDSTRVVFVRADLAGGPIYTMDRNGNNPLFLNSGPANYPVWSPDGAMFVFQGSDGIYTMNGSGTSSTRIAADGSSNFNTHPDWQPLPVGAGYARPKGATPFQTYFTVAYKNCTSFNEQHGAPLAILSCSPPHQVSDYATVGTLDANDQPAKSVGSLRLDVKPGNPATPENEADVKVSFSEKDIRNKSDLSDYTGELLPQATLRDTDKWNGTIGTSDGSEPGTSQDLPMPFAPNSGVPCATTADATVGSTCNMTTTMNALVIGMIQESRRMNVELGQVQVYDGGADGLGRTTSDNTLFLTQGIFIP